MRLTSPELVRSVGAKLRWSPLSLASGTQLLRYEVHRSRAAGFTPSAQTLVAELGPAAPTTYQDTTAAAQAAFSYRVVTVVATSTGQETSTSDELRVNTPPAGEAVLTVTAGDASGGATEVRMVREVTGYCDDASNYGAAPTFQVGTAAGDVHRALLRFDLRSIPSKATIRDATLRLPYTGTTGGQQAAIEVRRAIRAWAEGGGPAEGNCDGSGASWLDAKGGVRWSQLGGDATALPDATIPAASRTAAGTDTVSLTQLVADWARGRQANHGVLLRSANENIGTEQGVTYASDDSADPARRPVLTVSFADGVAPKAPRAYLSEPAAASPVSGNVRVKAAASDDGHVAQVDFLLDGRAIASDAAAPYETTLDTTTLSGGHDLAIRATDDAGNATTTTGMAVSADNTASPSASVTSPTASAHLSGAVPVTVAASDDVAVSKVEVLVDGTKIGEDTTEPYQATWDSESPLGDWYDGGHTISARVTDSSGQTHETSPVSVMLDNGGGSPHDARLLLGDPASTADDIVPAVVSENTAASAPLQDPYAGTVNQDGVSGGSLGRSVQSAPVDSTGGAVTGCPASAYCTSVNVTNTSSSTWDGRRVRLWYRWYAGNGAILFEGPAEGSLPDSFPPGASASVAVKIQPPRLPPGVELGRYNLRIDLYDAGSGTWFALQGNQPVDNPVQVAKNLDDKLGLEKFWTFEGGETGAGSLALTNVANGNMLWRWSPWVSPGRGLATVLDITYNSLEDHSSSPLGNNVSLAISGLTRFGEPLDIHPNKADQISGHSNKFIEFTDGDGTVHRFTGNDDGTWSRPPGGAPVPQAGEQRPDQSALLGAVAARRGDLLLQPRRLSHGGPRPQRQRDHLHARGHPPAEDPGGPKRRVTRVTDAGGRSYGITYWSKSDTHVAHVRGKIRRITDHSNRALEFDYYDDGNLLRIKQKGGIGDDGVPVADRAFVFTYTDSSGAGFAIPDPANRVAPNPKTPNQSTRIATIRDPRGNETQFTYFGPGSAQLRWRVRTRTDRSGAVTSLAYDLAARETAVTSPLSRVTSYRYDTAGKATAVVNAKGETASYTWTDDFHVAKVTEDNGQATNFTYDADSGYLTSRSDPLGNTTKLGYERRSLDSSDPAGHFVLLSTVTQPEGVASPTVGDFEYQFAYDAAGNPALEIDPAGSTTHYDWNLAGSAAPGTMRRMTDPRGGVMEMAEFDANGFPQRITDPEGGITRFGYDADGLLRFTQNPSHERFNNQPDPRSYRIFVDYDPFRRQVRASKPKSTDLDRGLLVWQVIQYDPNGNRVSTGNPVFGREQPPVGPRTEITFDAMDRATSVLGPDRSLPGGETVLMTYDEAGRLLSRTSPRGAATTTSGDFTTTYAYDPLDRVVRMTQSGAADETPRTSWTCYDNVGNRTAVVAPNAGLTTAPACPDAAGVSHTTHFTYDAAHRLTSATDPLGSVSRSEYNRNNWVTAGVDPRGKRQETRYDQRGLPVERVEPYIPGGRNLTTRMEYDASGNLAKEISPRAIDKSTTTDYVTTYTYDRLNRLIRKSLPKDGTTDAAYEHFGYDADGRVTVKSLPVTDTELSTVSPNARSTITYFDTGWVASTDDPGNPQVLFDYTPEGWQTSRTPRTSDDNTSPPDDSQVMRWNYNADGTLASRVDQGGQSATYDYDRDNHMVTASVASGVTHPDERPAVTTMTYDGFDEIVRAGTTKQLDDSTKRVEEFTTFDYDRNGNVVARGDEGKAGAETAEVKRNVFAYDTADRLVSQFELGWDTSCAGDRRITLSWQANNWLASQTIAKATAGCAQEQSGDPAAWQTTEQQTKSYNDNGLLRTMVTSNGAGEVKESHELGYDQDGGFTGQRTQDRFRRVGPTAGEPCSSSTCTETWTYDARGKLVRHDDGHGGVTAYMLDAAAAQRDPQVRAGNVTREAGPGRTIDRRYIGSQLESQTSGGVTTKNWYDKLGRLDCVTLSAGSQADCSPSSSAVSDQLVTDYTYDYLDRLESVRNYQSRQLRDESVYRYDALDRVVTQTETHKRASTLNRRTDFAYLGSSRMVAAETVTSNGTTGTGTPPDRRSVKSYSYDVYGQRYHLSDLASERQPDGSFQEREQTSVTYGYDPHASVSLLLRDSGTGEGNAKAVYGYTPYGDQDDTLSDGDEDKLSPFNPYRYTGKRWDAGSQTLDMGARNYDPASSRFLQQDVFRRALSDLGLTLDPLAQNRYALAGGNPTSFIEFDGHRPIPNGGGGESVPIGPNEDPSDDEQWWKVWGQRHETAVQFTAFLLRLLDQIYNQGKGKVTADRRSNRVIGGSAKGNGEDGFADVIYWTKDTIWVWEVKHEGGLGEMAGPEQLDRYVNQLKKQYPNMNVQKGFPLAPRAVGAGATIWWLAKLAAPVCGPLVAACALGF